MRIWATSLQLIKKFLVRKELEKIRGLKLVSTYFFNMHTGCSKFWLSFDCIKYGHLWDDIATTGASLEEAAASSKKAGRKRWWDSSLPVMRPWRPFPIWTDGKEFKLIGSLSSRYAFTHVALELDFFKTGPFR